MVPLVDVHAHVGGERERWARRNMLTVLCGTDPEDAERVLSMADEHTLCCCALHPWKADRYTVEDMLPYILRCPILGEIGMDSAWTDVDMNFQRRAFVRQLEIAAEYNKPVVLHTKGMEGEIARILRDYPVRKVVHWYSCMDYLEDYLEQDCWFTVGPDYAVNPAVQQVLNRAPLNRLLTETDGMSAVQWALGRDVQPEEVENVIRGELTAIAQAKGIAPQEARRIVYSNAQRVCGESWVCRSA